MQAQEHPHLMTFYCISPFACYTAFNVIFLIVTVCDMAATTGLYIRKNMSRYRLHTRLCVLYNAFLQRPTQEQIRALILIFVNYCLLCPTCI